MKPIFTKNINVDKNKAIAIDHISLVVKILNSKNIKYWLEYGTMLGAVREKGFIPWDSEFDIGVWNSEIEIHKNEIIDLFKKNGFSVNTKSKDRIKLVHKDLLIGGYAIDIHTYHIDKENDLAYVSYNRGRMSVKERIRKFIEKISNEGNQFLPMSSLVKLLLKNGIEYNNDMFIKYYGIQSKVLFELTVDNIKVKQTNKKYSLIKTYIYKVLKMIPKYFLVKIENMLRIKNSKSHTIQAIQLEYYTNLSLWEFENTSLYGPEDGIGYVKSIYGDNWHVGNPNWASSENKVNQKL